MILVELGHLGPGWIRMTQWIGSTKWTASKGTSVVMCVYMCIYYIYIYKELQLWSFQLRRTDDLISLDRSVWLVFLGPTPALGTVPMIFPFREMGLQGDLPTNGFTVSPRVFEGPPYSYTNTPISNPKRLRVGSSSFCPRFPRMGPFSPRFPPSLALAPKETNHS